MAEATSTVDSLHSESPEEIKRLIDWNVEVLVKLLKQVMAKREASGKAAGWDDEPVLDNIKEGAVADEVVAVVELPDFDPNANKKIDDKSIKVPPQVIQQLKEYVSAVALAYRSNPFNCLQHASHVTNAVTRLISRIAVPDLDSSNIPEEKDGDYDVLLAEHIHTQSYGIASDPLTQFTVVLAGLIHAVDHRGISNEDLANENPDLAAKYNGKSITEQLSVEKAWKKLMEPQFENLRRLLYANLDEKKRFRQILVNAVMATDKFDDQAQARRKARWEKSFGPGAAVDTDLNQKATCVIECLMQSADAFHFMQHWHVFVKWNERGFAEANRAFKSGRIPSDPAKTWYKDQLSFFDNFVIPLTMELKDIDAFVVNSDEYLNYALRNRQRWSTNGREIVAALVGKYANEKESESAKNAFITAISKEGSRDEEITARDAATSKHFYRLVSWNIDVLERILKQILAKRQASGKKNQYLPMLRSPEGKTVVDEVVEAIEFPPFDAFSSQDKLDVSSISLDVTVRAQLHEYVSHVCSQFRDNAFHCLDRSSQVSMSARKLMQRVTTSQQHGASEKPKEVFEETFGLSDDPLAQFAVVFAALIHDMDHGGVSNSQLIREDNELAKTYNGRCIWEQHAVDLAWSQLMQPEFEELRECICADESELKHFRQVVINSVLATDFMDEQLVALRKERWEKAFGDKVDAKKKNLNLKASIVVKLVMQASDSFHAIQHWQLFQKWSERYFLELYTAFKSGRLPQDPSIYWYKSELMFLDEYVIPLCKKMQKTGVFGPTADEFLAFATTNRDLWSAKGAALVQSFVNKYHGKVNEKSRADQISQRLSLSA